jgi:hypothetical protein
MRRPQLPQSQPVYTDRLRPARPEVACFPTGGRRPLVGARSATAPARVPHYVDPLPHLPNLPNLLAQKILHMWSTLPHWLHHMPALPKLLLENSNIHNF